MSTPKILTWQLPDEPENVSTVTDVEGGVWTKMPIHAIRPEYHLWQREGGPMVAWGHLINVYGPVTAPQPPRINETGRADS